MQTNTQHFSLVTTLLLVVIICVVDSCNRPTHQKVETNPTEVSLSSESEIPWTDPLFFIDGQLCQHVRKVFRDSRGDLWIGTNVYGLIRYNGDSLIYFDENHGLGAGRITEIIEDQAGNVWFGTAKGLSKYREASDFKSDTRLFETFDFDNGLIDEEIWSVLIDDDGLIWVGTINGVYQFDGQKFEKFNLPKASVKDTTSILSFDRVSQIIQDRNGTMWFGTDGFGLTSFKESEGFQHFTKENGLPDNNIYSLLEDSRGNIWVGTMYGGLARWNGVDFFKYPFGNPIRGWEIGALYEDSKSQVWLASENHGIYRYNATYDSFTNFHKGQGLMSDGVLSIYEDRAGRYWLGGWGGLFRYFPDEKDSTRLFSAVTKDGPWD